MIGSDHHDHHQLGMIFHSIAGSGSLNRWDRWYRITPIGRKNATYTPLTYIANWEYIPLTYVPLIYQLYKSNPPTTDNFFPASAVQAGPLASRHCAKFGEGDGGSSTRVGRVGLLVVGHEVVVPFFFRWNHVTHTVTPRKVNNDQSGDSSYWAWVEIW